jgi:hypothetical protein
VGSTLLPHISCQMLVRRGLLPSHNIGFAFYLPFFGNMHFAA